MNVVAPLTTLALVCALCITLAHGQPYNGILINGKAGTQTYDPFNTPHAQGNLHMLLQDGEDAPAGAAVANGQLGYFGGSDRSMIVYNFTSNIGLEVTPMPQELLNYCLTMLNSSAVLLCGGDYDSWSSACSLYNWNEVAKVNNNYPYNTDANTWTPFTSMPTPLTNFAMVTLYGRPYVFGGAPSLDGPNSDKVYTFVANAWLTRANMMFPVDSHRAIVLDADTALVCQSVCVNCERPVHICNLGPRGLGCGGSNTTNVIAACYTYSSTKDAWSVAASMNTARLEHGMAVYKGRVFVYGGDGEDSNSLSSVEMLAIDKSAWTTLPAPMFAADSMFQTVALR